MRNKLYTFLLCGLMVLLCVTCCATKPDLIESVDETEKGETVINMKENKIGKNTYEEVLEILVTKINYNTPFDPFEFVQELNEGMEVYKVFPDPNIIEWIALPGKLIENRLYFNYISPLYSRPIKTDDETLAMFNHQVKIAKLVNPGYVINMDIDIRGEDSKEIEKKTLKLNVRHGTIIHDYRKEGTIKYILKDEAGKFRYGAYFVVSAIVTKNEAEAEVFNALQEWMDSANRSEIADLLEKLLKK